VSALTPIAATFSERARRLADLWRDRRSSWHWRSSWPSRISVWHPRPSRSTSSSSVPVMSTW